jgi:hypothetical protein
MSESNNLLKQLGRVFLETVIESLEKPNESLNTNVNSRAIANTDIKGKLYGDVYDKNKKKVLNSYVSSIDKAAYIGDIYSEKGDSGSLPVLKNGTGYDAQFKGTVGGALSGLIYNYDSGRIDLIRTSIASGNVDEFKKARLILDPGNTDALDGSAKYYGDVYSTYYDDSDNDTTSAVLLIDSKNNSANFTGGITGALTGNADTVTNGVYTTGDQTIAGETTFTNSDGITCNKFKSVNTAGMIIQTGANNDGEGILFKRYYEGSSTLDNDIMFLHREGNVGIGTTTPSEKLDVNGNVNVSGSIASGSNINVTGTGTSMSNIITYNDRPIIIGGRGTTVANEWTWTKFNKAFDDNISVGDIAVVATVVRSGTQALTDMITYQINGIATDGFYVNANLKDGRYGTDGSSPYSGDFSYIATAMK